MTALPDELREAWNRLATGLIAVSGHLKEPYPDDPRWTPWSRFVEKETQRMDEAVREASAHLSRQHELLREAEERASCEPLGVDISDYSDEFCAGFLQGQVAALQHVLARYREQEEGW